MVRVDPNADLFPEGTYLFEVVTCTQTYTKSKGQIRFIVNMRDVHSNRRHSEGWMMEGEGLGRTVGYLKALGVTNFDDVRPEDLQGRRAIGRLKHKESETYGMQAQISTMWPESKPPKDWVAPIDQAAEDKALDEFFESGKPKADDADSTPF